jgi:hypothetical protein
MSNKYKKGDMVHARITRVNHNNLQGLSSAVAVRLHLDEDDEIFPTLWLNGFTMDKAAQRGVRPGSEVVFVLEELRARKPQTRQIKDPITLEVREVTQQDHDLFVQPKSLVVERIQPLGEELFA